MPAHSEAEWQGELSSGSGTFKAGDTISGSFSFKTRFEDEPGANPEQLIGAALAACYAMGLSAALERAGTPAESVKADATVWLRRVDDKPTITSIELKTVGRVTGLDEAAFEAAADAALEGCIIARALAGVGEITVEASLA
jgi:osmotically inducible protein OsmC